MKKIQLSMTEFDTNLPRLRNVLGSKLADEINVDEYCIKYVDQGAATDLWELPEVPSKSVVRLSGTIEQELGVKLPIRFIRPGGYKSVEEAVEHLVVQLKTLCQV